MAIHLSQSQGLLKVYFVILAKHGNKDNCSDDMCEAFQVMITHVSILN